MQGKTQGGGRRLSRGVWNSADEMCLTMYLAGDTPAIIAEKMHKNKQTVANFMSTPIFKEHAEIAIQEQREKVVANQFNISGLEFIAEQEKNLIHEMYLIATQADKETVRADAIKWMLERLPEYASKNVPVVNHLTMVNNNLTEEELDRNETAVGKLMQARDFLMTENPNIITPEVEIKEVEEITNAGEIEPDITGEDANSSGGDSETQGETPLS